MDLSAFRDASFDAVVAFEMIEHVSEHEQVLAEIARVLAPGGILVMSTPERRAYSDDRDFVNPHHARELTQDEFTTLLRSRFRGLALFAQRAVAGSRIEVLGGARGAGHSVRIERVEGDWRVAGPPSPLYLVAVAGNGELPALPGESSLFDYGLEVLAERQATVDELLQDAARAARGAGRRLRASAARGAGGGGRQGDRRVAAALERLRGSSTASWARTRRSGAPCAGVTTRIYDAMR